MTYLIRCDSTETLRHAIRVAKVRIHRDEEITRTFRTFPGGIERRQIASYRIGDYFDRIDLIQNESDPLSFELVFHVHQGVDSTWKALIVSVLRSINDDLPGISVKSIPSSI
jgi:hypothetical protein